MQMSLTTTRNVVLFLLGAGLTASVLPACLPDPPKPPEQPAAIPDMAQPPLTIDKQLSARQTFDQKVVPLLLPTCGACHKTEGGIGPAFLASGSMSTYDPYPVTSKWNGFLVDNPDLSLLLRKGEHEGPALTLDQYDAVLEWLKLEKAERDSLTVTPFKQQVKPFVPDTSGTLNKIDLGVLDSMFVGAYISFKATPLLQNGVTRGLEISQLKFFNVKPGAKAGDQRTLHVRRPLFIVWQGQVAAPDPVDSFNATDLTIPLDTSTTPPGTTITPGLLTLSDYRQGNSLSIAFDELRAVPPTPGSNPCKPAGFTYFKANVMPYMNKATTCVNAGMPCHSAAVQSGGVNMGPLTGMDDTQIANVCEILKYFNSIDTLRDNTNPNATYNHPYKFTTTNCTNAGFPTTCFTDWNAKLDMWKQNEQ
ncbi:MAG: hypothetical protein U1A78_33265 [Polyangia bacterium]